MWGSVFATAITTLLLLVIAHQIYNHLVETLTVPKVNDMVRLPQEKYAEIEKLIQPPKGELKSFLSNLKR